VVAARTTQDSALEKLAVYVFPMTDRKHEDCNFLVLNVADQAIIADAIAPQAPFFIVKSLAPLAGIFGRCQTLTQKAENDPLSFAVKFCNLLFSGPGNFNPPSQAAAPTPQA